MNIVVFESNEETETYIRKQLVDHELHFTAEHLDSESAKRYPEMQCAIVFIYSKVDVAVLDALPNLKLVVTRSTGFDHIDMDACAGREIVVSNVPHYGENTVAEHTFAMLLAISRCIPDAIERVQKGRFDATGLRGFDLKGKTIGVIGVGSIGRHVIRMARGFEMRVLGFDPFPDPELEAKLGFSYTGLDELLSQSDVVTLHCPYNEHTHHLLNEENLKKIKAGCVLINTARGALVDSNSLLHALNGGRISAVALDVLEEEGSIREETEVLTDKYKERVDLERVLVDHVLLRHPKVLVTPHSAFNSIEAIQRILDTSIENVKAFAKGQPINTLPSSQ